MHYKLSDDKGKELDSSDVKEPLTYLHASGHIIPGLFNALEGKEVGDKITTVVDPEDGYGKHDEALVQKVPRESFKGLDDLKVGMKVQAETNDGIQIAIVTELKDKEVTIDLNHPLADVTLHFDVEIVDIRDATTEEISHGHVHGPGGHEH